MAVIENQYCIHLEIFFSLTVTQISTRISLPLKIKITNANSQSIDRKNNVSLKFEWICKTRGGSNGHLQLYVCQNNSV